MHNQTTVTQLGMCKVKIEHINKENNCNFIAVPGNRQALLGMPDIEIPSVTQ